MRIAIASDHAGNDERHALVKHLEGLGHEVLDLGPEHEGSVDYPDYAAKVGHAVASEAADRGILICGTGIGICMAANKVRGIRAATLTRGFCAEMSRRHNDANVACFGTRIHSVHAIQRMTERFLETPFDGERHATRVAKIMALEEASVPA